MHICLKKLIGVQIKDFQSPAIEAVVLQSKSIIRILLLSSEVVIIVCSYYSYYVVVVATLLQT